MGGEQKVKTGSVPTVGGHGAATPSLGAAFFLDLNTGVGFRDESFEKEKKTRDDCLLFHFFLCLHVVFFSVFYVRVCVCVCRSIGMLGALQLSIICYIKI